MTRRNSKLSRREFIQFCSLLGLSSLAPATLATKTSRPTKVIILGAGAAGMSAGFLLKQQGIDVQILEASNWYGGRMKHTRNFTDFPISLGAEWLHAPQSELAKVAHKEDHGIPLTHYNETDLAEYFEDGELYREEMGEVPDSKFIGSSWLDVFERHLLPSIKQDISFNTVVNAIDYRDATIRVSAEGGNTFTADKVIVTVPLKMLQKGTIKFSPALPYDTQRTIDRARVWGGIKVFLEFKEAFYKTALSFPDSETKHGQRLYYDAAYGQNTQSHVLGLFAVGRQAQPYQGLSDNALRDYILKELDEVYEGAASRNYLKHISQNWSEEPFIESAYLADTAGDSISTTLSGSLQNKVFFAGEAYTEFDDWGSVHNAARSAKDATDKIFEQT